MQLPPKKYRDPEPKDKVIYQTGSWKIGMGINMTVRASFEHDPDGFRGFGNDHEEALANLNYYAFGAEKSAKKKG